MHKNRKFMFTVVLIALAAGLYFSMAVLDDVRAKSVQTAAQKAQTVPPSAKETAIKAQDKSNIKVMKPEIKLNVDLEIRDVTVCPGYSAGPAIWPFIRNNSNFTVKATVYAQAGRRGWPQKQRITINPHGGTGPLFILEGGKDIDISVVPDKGFHETKEKDNTCEISVGKARRGDGNGYCSNVQKCKNRFKYPGLNIKIKK